MLRAHENDVKLVVSAGQDQGTSEAAIALAERYAAVVPAVGVHPHEAAAAGRFEWLQSLARVQSVVAIGEIGLDYHYGFSARDVQRAAFAQQLELAAHLGLPVVIHSREAQADVAAVLRRHFTPAARGVLHCFTGSYDDGKSLIDEFDLYLGIGGAVTFKNARVLADAAARLPLDRLVLETDCPYMTPVPHRGKRNEPSYLPLICRRLAQLRAMSAQEIADRTSANALRLFSKARRAADAARNGIASVRNASLP